MKLSLIPHKARATKGESAWWYDGKGTIIVYINGREGVLSCIINRHELLKYIKRTKQ